MTDKATQMQILTNITTLLDRDINVLVVHGGGPFIKSALASAEIDSEFIDGQRITTKEAVRHVEMALKGEVNGNLVSGFNSLGIKAVGLSGKDGATAIATKRRHITDIDGNQTEVDLGHVGDIVRVDTRLISLLLDNGFLPVIACVAADENGTTYNINADTFAGHIAAAINADELVILTDVDGLLSDISDPDSRLQSVSSATIQRMMDDGTISGGMIPKIESCLNAIKNGLRSARIINGTKPGQLLDIAEDQKVGTLIT